MTAPPTPAPEEASALASTVIDGGFCIGCGTCAVAEPDVLGMRLDEHGRWQAYLKDAPGRSAGRPLTAICPFAEKSEDEDALARRFLPTSELRYDPPVGYHDRIWAGHAGDEYRRAGSSGGLASWFAATLLRRNLIDAVVHVLPESSTQDPRFRYAVSTTVEELLSGSKSHYHSVTLHAALPEAVSAHERVLVIGVPCFIKGLRNLMRVDDLLRSRVVYTAAIFCGHMKSTAYGELLGWQMAVPPDELAAVSFREKLEGLPANAYGTRATRSDGESVTRSVKELPGTDWGLGLFKFDACDFCDDISGETADVSFGDAWLPEYTADWRGTSLVVVRDPALSALLADGAARGDVRLEEVSTSASLRSQDANFRHRREGLAYRVAAARAQGRWVPPKRVVATGRHLTRRERRRFEARSAMSALSHEAFREARNTGDLALFWRRMDPLIAEYRSLMTRDLLDRAVREVRRAVTGRLRRAGYLRRNL
ncbi:Coenzyme F420 hydrogenase/dehydrogenase, beta subunit C-terminal domain [Blastococcus sp. KM273129]|uniref:Coenzyme F420 hydrogenase/dehydrogenase, beta subunit C-terminal domain n=1 Tax=Blastococcus sp. KM273129 TaxID=2570315 RepID=UPI001F381FBA|nr:Coenzyme F420 hydrogenase/dehydrogenase, beta subunit C-terminal domain [Blastococcus sp. KM273129]